MLVPHAHEYPFFACDVSLRVVYLLYMEFEFDPVKSESNSTKHGIDFETAKLLWDDPDLIEIPARSTDEPRWLVVGRIRGKHWSAVITHRNGKTRIISVRRSRDTEIGVYEGN